MTLTKRGFLGLGLGLVLLPAQALAFSGSSAKPSRLPGIDVTLTRDPAGDPIEPIHIDGEHGKALVQMGAMQAGQFMANILAPKLETLSGIDGKNWHWVLSGHLTETVVRNIFDGGGTQLSGLQFAQDAGKTTWDLKIIATKAE